MSGSLVFFGSSRNAARPKASMVRATATACPRVPSGDSTMTPIRCLLAGKTAHQSTATMVYTFCLTVDGLEVNFSVALCNAAAVASGKSGFFETARGDGDVIGDTTMDEEALLEVIEHIAGPGIIITGMSDAADIHRVAFLGFEACGFF